MFDTLIKDLRSTTKPSEKIAILEKFKDKVEDEIFLQNILRATFDPFMLFHVKIDPSSIKTTGTDTLDDFNVQQNVITLLNNCSKNNSNKQNREYVLLFLSTLTEGSQELLYSTINKDWKAGVSNKTIKKLYNYLIPSFDVQLANKYLDVIKKKSYQPKSRYCSIKLDGVRCIFLRLLDDNDYKKGIWKAYSRQGLEFLTVDHLKPQLEYLWELHGKDFWDGELYVDGFSFEDIQTLVTSFTKGTANALDFRAFICGDKDDFLYQNAQAKSFKIVTEEFLNNQVAPQIKFVEQKLITEEQIPEELEKAFEFGYEGIMLRDPDQLYDFKRSDALIKLKESDSAKSQEKLEDCLIVDMVIDKVTVVINGEMTYQNLLTKLIVEQKDGTLCKVGSGFDLNFRYYYTEHPEEIKGKVGEFKFQGYGSKGRMRFPRLYRVREDLTWGE